MKASVRGNRFGRHRRLVVLALAVIATSAKAALVDIAWDATGRFETDTSIAPGKFAEVCGRLAKGQSVAWSFKGDRPMNFNIHYHEDKLVVFPAKQDDASDAQGRLVVGADQDYCWMWTNMGDASAQLRLTLQR
jgi:hypothetical protein